MFFSQPLPPNGRGSAKHPQLMSIISFIQSKLMSLLMGFMFLCTAVLGTLLLITQRALDWLDGQHPQVNHWVQASSSWLMRHPKTISATLASLLLAGAGGAFAIANLGHGLKLWEQSKLLQYDRRIRRQPSRLSWRIRRGPSMSCGWAAGRSLELLLDEP